MKLLEPLALQVRARCVSRAMNMQSSSSLPEGVEQRIANLYAPNLKNCWGIECVQVAPQYWCALLCNSSSSPMKELIENHSFWAALDSVAFNGSHDCKEVSQTLLH